MPSLRSPVALAVAVVAAAPLAAGDRTFDEDVAFLRRHVEVVVLGEATGPRVAVVPAWQGRVATSTVGGPQAPSHGWINEELVASGRLQPHINAFGGEDRLWLGPEGGQFSIFFRPGAPFDLEHWQTPPLVDTETWPAVERGPAHVRFRRSGRLVNRSGTRLDVTIDRTVRLLDRDAAASALGIAVPDDVRVVAFESENTLANLGPGRWTKETGLLSLWVLGMFKPSPATTVVVPYREGPDSELGPVVNDAYFGKVPADRLVARDGVLFFRGDGLHRSKIGLSPRRARPVLGSYDAARGLLTIVSFDKPEGATDYVNSMWEVQEDPFAGDVVNSYNDGPPAPGAKPLGPFYELETSSPAAALGPGESLTHVHRTFHFQGDERALDPLARRLLGVGLDAVRTAVPSPGAAAEARPVRTLLAIGAHAGDAELTAGAVLARHRRMGDRVVLLHLTLGEGGNPKMSPAAYGEQKRREALAAAAALGAEALFGPWKDGELRDTEEAARWVADAIRQVKPTHVITHWKHSLHPDHEAAHRIVGAAALLASLEGFASAHPRHRGVRGVYFADNWEDAEGFAPYLYVDVSEDLAAWRAAASSYEFVRGGISPFPYLEYYESLARVRGAVAGRRHAVALDVEPFARKRVLDALP